MFIAGAGLAAILLLPSPSSSSFAFGLHYTLGRLEQVLSLLGLGLALAIAPPRLCLVGVALFVAGIFIGGFASDWLAAAASAHPGLLGFAFLLSPGSCLLVGLGLAAPRRLARWVIPPVAFVPGFVLGLVMSFTTFTVAQWWFAAGAVAAGLFFFAAPLLSLRSLRQPWFHTASRIFGSWLVAIGALLVAVQLVPPRTSPPEPAEAPRSSVEPASGG